MVNEAELLNEIAFLKEQLIAAGLTILNLSKALAERKLQERVPVQIKSKPFRLYDPKAKAFTTVTKDELDEFNEHSLEILGVSALSESEIEPE